MKTKLLLITFLSILLSSTANAATQQIDLRYGWNFISLSVTPVDPTVGAIFLPIQDKFEAIWKIDPIEQEWFSFPPPIEGMTSVDTMEVGRGYWVKVTNSVTLHIEGLDAPPSGSLQLYPGWNAVGFPVTQPTDYKNLLTGAPYSQVWTYDVNSGEFKGIELIPGTQTVTREDFTQIQPGQGYWVYVSEQTTLGPILATALPEDVDQPPLLPSGAYGEKILWDLFTSGDEDIGEDGYYDRPNTQRAITFRDNLNEQKITIYNKGTGVLRWNAEIVDPVNAPWLKIKTTDSEGNTWLITSTSGEQAQNTGYIHLRADRTRLAPIKSGYQATIKLTSNGTAGEEQQERFIRVYMFVANIVGDYNVLVKIHTINGKKADMHNPRYYVSLYEDRDGVKGIIDHSRSLLMSRRFYLAGVYVKDDANQFTLSGTIVLPPKDSGLEDSELNPYKVELQREITLIGTRSEPTDANLGPLDLKGDYRETIRNVLPEPVYLEGTFEAVRTEKKPLVTDQVTVNETGDTIPDGTGILEKEIVVSDNILITEVDITVNLTHTRKEDLKVKLVSPFNTPVRLREHSSHEIGQVTYDTTAVPIDSMDNFIGELSAGTWKLIVEDDVPGEIGSLIACSLDIKGTKVFSVEGTVTGVPDGATIMLTGCGIVKTTTVQGGTYKFDNLIDCKYQIKVIHPGYEQEEEYVLLSGGDMSGVNLNPNKVVTGANDFLVSPLMGQLPLKLHLIDLSDLNPVTNWNHKWTISDLSGDSVLSEHVIDGQGSDITYTINKAGIYQVKLEITNLDDPPSSPAPIEKPTQYILVGNPNYGAIENLPTNQQRAVEYFNLFGFSGSTLTNYSIYHRDSATFDIDRLPLSVDGTPGLEDTNEFLGSVDGPDPVTGTNKLGVNGTLDPAIGLNAVKADVSIGQQIIGTSVSGHMKLHIGTIQP